MNKEITAPQAWKTLGLNKRLATFVEKKYEGKKTLIEWKSRFEADQLR